MAFSVSITPNETVILILFNLYNQIEIATLKIRIKTNLAFLKLLHHSHIDHVFLILSTHIIHCLLNRIHF
jgi:hypothetical protein